MPKMTKRDVLAAKHGNRGNTLFQQGDWDGAIKAYRQALAIKPNLPPALYNIGNVLKKQGDKQGAIQAYRLALVFKPDYIEAHYNLGNVLKDLGDFEGATKSYRLALAHFNKTSTCLKRLFHATFLVGGVAILGGFLVSLVNHYNPKEVQGETVPQGRKVSGSPLVASYDRDNWNFNSRAARKRLSCTEDEDVDHVVSLKEAFDSGASAWPSALKKQFANDPSNQWCLNARMNRSKSDGDLAEWNGGSCDLRKRIATSTKILKAKYDLDIDPAESSAIREAINRVC